MEHPFSNHYVGIVKGRDLREPARRVSPPAFRCAPFIAATISKPSTQRTSRDLPRRFPRHPGKVKRASAKIYPNSFNPNRKKDPRLLQV